MKLATFVTRGTGPHVGAVVDDDQTLVDLTASGDPSFADMLALIDAGPEALDRAAEVARRREVAMDLRDAALLAPLLRPRQMRDFLVFEKHVRQARANRYRVPNSAFTRPVAPEDVVIPAEWYASPLYYRCSTLTVIGHEEDIVHPRYTSYLDFELEFAAITGRKGKNIARPDAGRHIFGYCIFNDMSARDAQYASMGAQMGPGKGKDFDGSNVLGPWIVTADEIADSCDLTMIARINGQEIARGSSKDMQHSFEDMISYVSSDETIHPGEVLGSGTVGGGCGLENGRFLAVGDTVELEVSGLGVLRNRIVRAGDAH